METSSEDISHAIGLGTQILLTLAAVAVLGTWAWGLANGSAFGFILLFLLSLLFVSPIIVYMFPLVSLVVSVIAWVLIALFRRLRSQS